jgi:hypothetical protein
MGRTCFQMINQSHQLPQSAILHREVARESSWCGNRQYLSPKSISQTATGWPQRVRRSRLPARYSRRPCPLQFARNQFCRCRRYRLSCSPGSRMFHHVEIRGGGIAASCCARLLSERNLNTSIVRGTTSAAPTLLINLATAQLLKDVFRADEGLFSELNAIRRRVVLWGNEQPATLPHAGFVVSEVVLLERLWSGVKPVAAFTGKVDFTIYSTPESTTGREHRFG